jgi:hypothetical protein
MTMELIKPEQIADFFKGNSSHEYRYECVLPLTNNAGRSTHQIS